MNTIYSGLFKLNARDLLNGLAIAAIGTILMIVVGALINGWQTLLTQGFWLAALDLDLKAVGLYLSKNLLSDSQGNVLGIGRKANQ